MSPVFKISFIFVISIILAIPQTFAAGSSDGYPKPRDERKLEKMGSVLNGEGIIFRPGKPAKQPAKTIFKEEYELNKYLWQAATEVTANIPLVSVDSTTGVIITDWYSTDDESTINHKANIFIKTNEPDAKALEIKVFTRILKNNNWLQVRQPRLEAKLAAFLEKQILRKGEALKEQAAGTK